MIEFMLLGLLWIAFIVCLFVYLGGNPNSMNKVNDDGLRKFLIAAAWPLMIMYSISCIILAFISISVLSVINPVYGLAVVFALIYSALMATVCYLTLEFLGKSFDDKNNLENVYKRKNILIILYSAISSLALYYPLLFLAMLIFGVEYALAYITIVFTGGASLIAGVLPMLADNPDIAKIMEHIKQQLNVKMNK